MAELSDQEQAIARIAAEVVHESGGTVTFDEYDKMMCSRLYFAPINWIAGWGLPKPLWKRNNDRLAAFAACQIGIIRQTKTGYEVVPNQTAAKSPD